MKQSLTKDASLLWLRILLVTVMSLSFRGGYATNPFELIKFYTDQPKSPQQPSEKTSLNVCLKNVTDEPLTIFSMGMELIPNEKEVTSKVLKPSQPLKLSPGEEGVVCFNYAENEEFFSKCVFGENSICITSINYENQVGRRLSYAESENTFGTVNYNINSNPTSLAKEPYYTEIMEIGVIVGNYDMFEDIIIYDYEGENGQILATKEDFYKNGGNIKIPALAFPLQVYGSWSEGSNYEMTVRKSFYEPPYYKVEPIRNEAPSSLYTINGTCSSIQTVDYYDDYFTLLIGIRDKDWEGNSFTLQVNHPDIAKVSVIDEYGLKQRIYMDSTGEKIISNTKHIYVEGGGNLDDGFYDLDLVEINGNRVDLGSGDFEVDITDDIETISVILDDICIYVLDFELSVEDIEDFESLSITTWSGRILASKSTINKFGHATPNFRRNCAYINNNGKISKINVH